MYMNPSRKQGYFRRVHTPVVTDVDSMTRSGAIFRSVPYAIERSTRAGKFWDVVIHYDCVEDIKSKDSLFEYPCPCPGCQEPIRSCLDFYPNVVEA